MELRKVEAAKVFYVKQVDSTQDEAFRMFHQGAKPPLVVVADVQTSGRGRYGRSWSSGKGGAWVTFLIRPNRKKITNEWVYGFAASLGVVELLVDYGIAPRLVWPNDVFVEDAKVCGVLVEAEMSGTEGIQGGGEGNKHSVNSRRKDVVAVGVGLNVSNDVKGIAAPYAVTNMSTLLGAEPNLEEVRGKMISKLIDKLMGVDQRQVVHEYKRRLDNLGKLVKVKTDDQVISGLAADVDFEGMLVVRSEDGVFRILNGELLR